MVLANHEGGLPPKDFGTPYQVSQREKCGIVRHSVAVRPGKSSLPDPSSSQATPYPSSRSPKEFGAFVFAGDSIVNQANDLSCDRSTSTLRS